MKEINANFSFNGSKNAQHYQVHGELLKAVPVETAEQYGFGQQRSTYNGSYDVETGIYAPNTAFYATSGIAELDARRDYGYKYLEGRIDVAKYSLDPEEVEAGKLLAHAGLHNTNDARQDYYSNTSQLAKYIETLRKPEYQAAVTKLSLTPGIDAAEEVNNQFQTLYETRYQEYLSRISTETMKSIRPKVDAGAHDMFKAINALYLVNELVTKDEATRTALGELIDKINAILAWFERLIDGTADINTDNAPAEGETTTPDSGDDSGSTGGGNSGGGNEGGGLVG